MGAQCTGKTTLVNRLAQHFHDNPPPAGPPAIIKEVARTVLVKHNFTANDITSSQERCLLLQRLILEAQAKAEREVLQGEASWFISDRSGVDPMAYAAQHGGEGWEAVKSFPSSFHLEPRASHAPSCLPVSVLLTAKSKPPSLQSKS